MRVRDKGDGAIHICNGDDKRCHGNKNKSKLRLGRSNLSSRVILMRLQVTFARIGARAYMYGSSLYKAHRDERETTKKKKKMRARACVCVDILYIYMCVCVCVRKKEEKKGETEASGCFRR